MNNNAITNPHPPCLIPSDRTRAPTIKQKTTVPTSLLESAEFEVITKIFKGEIIARRVFETLADLSKFPA